jgi:hypothetical protein
MKLHSILGSIVLLIIILLVVGGFFFPLEYKSLGYDTASTTEPITLPLPFQVTHIKTPDQVKAIYMSGWVAGNEKLRDNLINIIDTTELNAVVIDVKDYTGRISFLVKDPELQKLNSAEERVKDIREFIGQLHDRGIYVIARISSFQDSFLVHTHPEFAVKTKAGAVWKDYKGVSWLDAGAKPVWDYLIKIGDESYSVGFDELNFDYIRFPSDGNMMDIAYSFSNGRTRSAVINDFFEYIGKYFREKNIPTSADLFGLTTSTTGDLGIGQVLEYALRNFDFVAPMVYPSHYPPNFNGYPNPAAKPYEVISYAMTAGIKKAEMASTSPEKLRPWLQDFSINGTHYTSEMIRAQIQATYDVGLNSWMLWNASNVYTVSALLPASTSTAQR